MKIRAILTGASGMVGEGVLHECLNHPEVEALLVLGRTSCGVRHAKLKEILHQDFFNLSAISSSLSGYNTCYFCLGVSSIGMKEQEYFKLTHTLTLHVAQVLSQQNPDMTFCYISGTGTDSTEKGLSMWARVKGKTENDLMKLNFKKVFNFRPSYLHPTKGLKNTLSFYKYISWMYSPLKALFPNQATTLRELGLAMIHASFRGFGSSTIEVKDIIALAKT